jgi:hypothetical protein
MSVNSVYIRLVGVDIASLSIYETLPLSSDLEAQVVQTAYAMLVQVPPADRSESTRD